jgi:hypothetical protein
MFLARLAAKFQGDRIGPNRRVTLQGGESIRSVASGIFIIADANQSDFEKPHIVASTFSRGRPRRTRSRATGRRIFGSARPKAMIRS